ncbi:MAG: hypothetical protein K1W31_06495 [Lachnospiraceae bacterium]
MIHIIPRMKFTIQTGKSPEEVRALLRSITDTQNKWLNVPGDKAFIGKVGETDFKFLPRLGEVLFAGVVMHVKDSFLPVIIGQIRGQENGTTVIVRMRLLWLVFAFLCVWFGITGMVFLAGLLAVISGQPDGWGITASAAGFILVGQLLVRGGFYIPAKSAKRKLEDLLEGEAEDD